MDFDSTFRQTDVTATRRQVVPVACALTRHRQCVLALGRAWSSPCVAQSPAFEAVRVSACALSGAGMEDLTSVVRELAEIVSAIEASVRVIDARLSEPNAGRRHAAPAALSAAEAAEPSEKQEQPSFGSSADLQAEFRAIRDSLSKVKLPQDLVVGDSRAGIGKGDLARFQVIQKCARFPGNRLEDTVFGGAGS